jgi:2,4-dienoyl-CoA reductase-like NADH-dependent reductase (Old Yellow Enzyme family)
MKDKITHPLALVVAANKMTTTENPTVLLVDCSTSMATHEDGQARYMHARATVRRLIDEKRPAYIFGFSDSLMKLEKVSDIHPDGGTFLAETLREAARLNPGRLILVTDGAICDAESCAKIVQDEMLIVDAIFIGRADSADMDTLRRVANGTIRSVTVPQLGDAVLLLTR